VADHGFRDGISKEAGMTIDNLDYYNVHAIKYENIRIIVTSMDFTPSYGRK